MLLFVFLAAVVAVVLGFLAGSFLVVAAVALIFFVVALLLLRDLRELAACSFGIEQQRYANRKSQGKSSLMRLSFSWAQELLQRIEALHYRLHSLHSHMEQERSMREVAEDPGLSSLVDESATTGGALYGRILEYVMQRVSASCCGLIFDPRIVRGESVITHPERAEALQEWLSEQFSSHFSGDNAAILGNAALDGNGSLRGGLETFGLVSAISHPLEWQENGETFHGIFWLGYDGGRGPHAGEDVLVERLARRIERDLAAQRHISELSSRAAQAEIMNREKSEFIAHMSHDIRSPLNNIKSILALFKLEGITTETEQMLDVALNNCESMAEIVEDILDYSKYSAGRLTARRERVDLVKVVSEVVEGFVITARLRGLTLKRTFPKERALIWADKRQVKRIVSNLLSNAIKYTMQGEVEIRVNAHVMGFWQLLVRDTGIGMSKQQVKALFTPFTRFHGEEVEGIGLGLTLTQILTGLNGGEIRVDSEMNRGSTFAVLLPMAEEEQRCDSDGWRDSVGVAGRRWPSVLIVDDDPDCVDSLARTLEQFGNRVMRAITVADAVSIISFEQPDFVISDATMPDGGGLRIARYVAESAPATRVIILTGNDDEEGRGYLLQSGVSRVLCKPADISEIVEIMESEKAVASPAVSNVVTHQRRRSHTPLLVNLLSEADSGDCGGVG